MARRLTENAFPMIRNVVTESSANTYTEEAIDLPLAVIASNRVQAIELMRIAERFSTFPSGEPGQDNNVQVSLHRSPRTDTTDLNNDDEIWMDQARLESEDAAAVEMMIYRRMVRRHNMTDHDGNGLIVAERTIHHGIKGTGNASAQNHRIKGMCHLVVLEAAEVIQAILEAD